MGRTLVAAFTAAIMMPVWLWSLGVMEFKHEHARNQFDVICAMKDGTNKEYAADDMDLHGDLLQLWAKDGLTQVQDPICVVHIVDHDHTR
jgi:hypothetical protein